MPQNSLNLPEKLPEHIRDVVKSYHENINKLHLIDPSDSTISFNTIEIKAIKKNFERALIIFTDKSALKIWGDRQEPDEWVFYVEKNPQKQLKCNRHRALASLILHAEHYIDTYVKLGDSRLDRYKYSIQKTEKCIGFLKDLHHKDESDLWQTDLDCLRLAIKYLEMHIAPKKKIIKISNSGKGARWLKSSFFIPITRESKNNKATVLIYFFDAILRLLYGKTDYSLIENIVALMYPDYYKDEVKNIISRNKIKADEPFEHTNHCTKILTVNYAPETEFFVTHGVWNRGFSPLDFTSIHFNYFFGL